jgi:hypothetical protein
MQGITWNILGQTYVPKTCTEDSFSWRATFPPGTFLPPHIHPGQRNPLIRRWLRPRFLLPQGEKEEARPDLARPTKGEWSNSSLL